MTRRLEPKNVKLTSIASALGLSTESTWAFARALPKQYLDKPKRWQGDKHRCLVDVRYPAKKRLQSLHSYFQSARLFHEFAHGGIRGRSSLKSSRIHAGRPFKWTLDVKNCFPSIGTEQLSNELNALGFREDVVSLLCLLFVRGKEIPQGSPLSTDAVNLFFWPIDSAIAATIRDCDVRYTRVTDDFVLSARNVESGSRVAKRLEQAIVLRGLVINDDKRKLVGFQARPDEQTVHGLSISAGAGISLARGEIQSVVEHAERYVASAKSASSESFESVAATRRSLAGKLNRCRQMDFAPSKHVARLLKAGDRHIAEILANARIDCKNNRWWHINKLTKRNEPRRIAELLSRPWCT